MSLREAKLTERQTLMIYTALERQALESDRNTITAGINAVGLFVLADPTLAFEFFNSLNWHMDRNEEVFAGENSTVAERDQEVNDLIDLTLKEIAEAAFGPQEKVNAKR